MSSEGLQGVACSMPSVRPVGGWGRRCVEPRVPVGEGPAILTVAPFLPSHLCTQGLPGKQPPLAPLPSVWQEAPGCPRPLSSGGFTVGRTGGPGEPMSLWASPGCPGPLLSRGSTVGRAGGPRKPMSLRVSPGYPCSSWFPVNAAAPRGPEEAGQMLPSSPSRPGAGWVAACSQGLLLWIQIKQFHKLSRGLSCVQAGPCPPELELDPVVWVMCGQGAGLGRPGHESLAFPGALGQGGGCG